MVTVHSLHGLYLAVCLEAVVIAASSSYYSWRWEATPNSRLLGHVIETKMATTLLSCLSSCTRSSACWTVNYRAADGTCELNDADDRWDDVSPSAPDAEFSLYKRTVPRSPQDIDGVLRPALPQCHPTHELLGGSCLEIVHDASVNFSDAKKACDHKFGRLAVLDSAALESVLNILPLPYKFWIDITRRTDGEMMWGATNTVITINRPPWHGGQPDDYQDEEDCGSIEEWSGVYGYLDVPCMINDRGYICQYDPWVYLAW